MADVTLVNQTRRPPHMLVLILTKQVAPVQVTNRTTQETRQGERAKKISTKLVPDSLRIPSGASVDVDEKVLHCPEVAEAIRLRKVRVERKQAKPNGGGPKVRRRRA